MCISQNSDEMEEKLYEQYAQIFTDYLHQNVVFMVEKLQGRELLEEIKKRWSNHCLMMKYTELFFEYLVHPRPRPLTIFRIVSMWISEKRTI